MTDNEELDARFNALSAAIEENTKDIRATLELGQVEHNERVAFEKALSGRIDKLEEESLKVIPVERLDLDYGKIESIVRRVEALENKES